MLYGIDQQCWTDSNIFNAKIIEHWLNWCKLIILFLHVWYSANADAVLILFLFYLLIKH
jgi:hypothetical protein